MTEDEIEQAKQKAEAGEAVYTVRSMPWMISVGNEFNYPDTFFSEDFVMYSSEW
ncbi:MAG: hypothetical protein NC394_00800 [Bacteroides sp.]|nr:hypothetical protein [Bacteroides sp.]